MIKLKKHIPSELKILYRKLRRKWTSFYIRGNKVCCPICNHTYRNFGSFGLLKRKNAKCYNCGSLERHRLLYIYLIKEFDFFNLKKKITLLHFAPERFFYQIFCNNSFIQYQPVDLFPDIYDYGGNIEIKRADITDLPFESDCFDFIICNHVLEHVPDDYLAMKELYRVLKPKGIGIIQVPINSRLETTYEDFSIIDPIEREVAFGQKDHVRWYGLDYSKKLESAGFRVDINKFVTSLSKKEIFKFGLIPYEDIYLAKKE